MQNFKIDFVFPYVNPNDINWQNDYKKYKNVTNFEKNERFRDFSLLKYIFRSIEDLAPFINNVFLLVSSESQVPSFLNKSCPKLKIVTHDQFIPKEYLPAFNSNTIEMFISNIPNLSEHFIYSNDDFMFLNESNVEDFFSSDGKIIKLAYSFKQGKVTTLFQSCCKNTFDVVSKLFDDKKISNKDYKYIRQFHGAASPRLLSDCKECYTLLESKIKKSISRFRNLEKNYNQYLFGYYSLFKGNATYISPTRIGSYVEANFGLDKILETITNSSAKMLCINDTNIMNKDLINKVYWNLEVEFPKKSAFEN